MITVYDEDGRDISASLPTKWVVCPRCQGGGTEDVWEGGMTSDEMYEHGPEFLEDYLGGMYSKTCEECGGRTTITDLDYGRASAAQVAVYEAAQRELAEYAALAASERRF